MTQGVRLIVTDSSPLITLAAAESLHLLTIPGIPVLIPDMVYYEVTRNIAKLGATNVVQWVKANRVLVRLEPTEVFAEYQALLTLNPKTSSRDRGERAATEVLTDAIIADPHMQALLLYEDSDIMRRRFADLLPERVMPISTGGFLRTLEEAGRIQSADRVLDEAMTKGRDVTKQRIAVTSKEIAHALKETLPKGQGGRGI